MGNVFWWFYDAVVIAVLFGTIYKNAKKGFVKSIMAIVAYLTAIIIAVPVSNFAGNKIYEIYIKDKSTAAIENSMSGFSVEKEIKNYIDQNNYGVEISEQEISEAISNTKKGTDVYAQIASLVSKKTGNTLKVDDTFKDNIKNRIGSALESRLSEKMPDFVAENLTEMAINNTDQFLEKVSALDGTSNETAVFIETEYLKPFTVNIIKIISFFIVFFILLIVLHILIGGIEKIGSVSGLNKYDTVLGGALGFAEAIIIIFTVVFIVKLMIMLSDGDLIFLNEETIDKTKLFRIFYNIKILE